MVGGFTCEMVGAFTCSEVVEIYTPPITKATRSEPPMAKAVLGENCFVVVSCVRGGWHDEQPGLPAVRVLGSLPLAGQRLLKSRTRTGLVS